MIVDLKIPAGSKLEERMGGQAALRAILDSVRRDPLTGYIKTSLTLEGDTSNGFLVFDQGAPIIALYSFKPSGNNSVEMIYRGGRAAEFTLGDSIYPDTTISIIKTDDHGSLTEAIEDLKKDSPSDLSDFIDRFYRDNLKASNETAVSEAKTMSDLKQAIAKFHRERAAEMSGKRMLKDVSLELEEGESFLVEEHTRDFSHSIFVSYLGKGYNGLAITRTNPRLLRKLLGSEEAEIIWLTDHESGKESTIAPSLEKIIVVLEEFMSREERSVILVDDLQYLISSNSFEGAVRLIRSLVDRISEKSSIFLLSIDPDSLNPQERSILEREMRLIKER